MACLTLHQWADWRVGVQELRRVARKRVVIFTYDPILCRSFLAAERLPARARASAQPSLSADRATARGHRRRGARRDGCHPPRLRQTACWQPIGAVRGHIWTSRCARAYRLFSCRAPCGCWTVSSELAEDLETGRWQQRNRELLSLEQLDLGYRLLVTEL